jgi:hypothetical protein
MCLPYAAGTPADWPMPGDMLSLVLNLQPGEAVQRTDKLGLVKQRSSATQSQLALA